MRVVFAGTPAFAATALEALLASRHEVVLVLTQPDRPAGRGQKPAESPINALAQLHTLPLFQPATLKDPQALQRLKATGAHCMVVAAYGLILPQPVLDLFPRGCLNVHASLLPRWRGAAPIQRALLANDAQTGVCIMRMEAGLDSGPVYRCKQVPVAPDATAGTLHDELAAHGARLLIEVLDALDTNGIEPVAQRLEGVVYAPKIDKREAMIDWRRPADFIDRQVRAFNPVPGASSVLAGEPVKIWQGTVAAGTGEAGQVLALDDHALLVACGSGAFAISQMQRAGGRRMPVKEFLRGLRLVPGARFD